MSFIQQFRVSLRHTTVAMMIFASVSFYACKAGKEVCAIPESIASVINRTDCATKSAIPPDSTVTETETDYDFIGGPMNQSASLPIHMTE